MVIYTELIGYKDGRAGLDVTGTPLDQRGSCCLQVFRAIT